VNPIDPEALYSFKDLPGIGIHLSRETVRRKMEEGTFPKSVRISKGRVVWPGKPLKAWKDELPVNRGNPKTKRAA
jgi:hypothetical protein